MTYEERVSTVLSEFYDVERTVKARRTSPTQHEHATVQRLADEAASLLASPEAASLDPEEPNDGRVRSGTRERDELFRIARHRR